MSDERPGHQRNLEHGFGLELRRADPDACRRLIEEIPLTLYAMELRASGNRARTLYVSPQAESTFGIPGQRFVDAPDLWLEIIHEEDRARVLEAMHKAGGDRAVDVEYRVRRADGTCAWLRNIGNRFFDSAGRPELVLGAVMDVDDRKQTHDDLQRANVELRMLATEMSLARLEAEQRADELLALNRVASALTNVTDLQALLRIAVRELTLVFDTRGSTVTLIDESRQHAEVVAEYFTDPDLPSVLGLQVPLDIPAWKQLDEERAAIVIERPQEDSILGSVRDVMRDREVSQLLIAPLISRGVLIGNMSVSHAPGRFFAPHEVMLAQTLATPLAQAVENARLFAAAERAMQTVEASNHELARLSVTDALTGLPNRRLFHDQIESEWRRAQRSAAPIAVLMIDIDFFKSYNDEYGHQRGDECLVSVARALQSALHRAGDLVARYGGEEFVAILPNADGALVKSQGERICELVRALAIPHGTSAAAPIVTVSVGCAALLPNLATVPGTLIASADLALYEAKHRGRNRVICAGE